jgi:hypothetical protein
MNTFVIAALFATVAAEEGYSCQQPSTAWTVESVADVTAATDATECKAACLVVAEDDANDANDYCCSSKTTEETATDEGDEEFECTLWSEDTAADANIKEVTAAEEDPVVTYAAWMWVAGVEQDELGEGSATMISSAIATIAAVAMIAY